METFIFLWFFFVFALVIFVFAKNIKQWQKNNNSPRLTVDSLIVDKRSSSHHHHGGATTHSYHVTFQFESGDRLEMRVPRENYGNMVYGDRGKLTFQGTRFISFERIF